MPRIWEATDTTEPVYDSMMEAFGNAARYNIISGCAPSYSAADMTVTVAAGSITHDGTTVTVTGNNVTLVADATHPRWVWVAIDSAGTATLVSGTPAADPAVPEPGDNVEVCLVQVAAGQTTADASTVKLDKRMFAPVLADTATSALDVDETATSTTLADVADLAASLAANTAYAFRALIHYTSAAANDYKFAFTVPASAVIHAQVMYINTSAAATLGTLTSSGASLTANGFGATAPGIVVVHGSVITGASAGDLQFQHALGASTGTNTTLKKSRLEVF